MSTEIATVALHVERSGAGATPLLLLHGMTGSSDDWRHVFDLAALRARYDVIAPDLRGHGRSRDIGERFSHRACAADVLAMLDAQGLQRQPVAAIGLSLGGNTLLHAATQQPERFSALVLVSTTLEYDERARAIMSQMRFDALPEVEQQRMRAVHGGGEAQIDALIAAVRAMADDPAGATLAEAELSRIAAPALVVYGDRDPLYPLEMALRQARGLPRAELWVVPGEAHLPVFGAWRPTFEAQALAFIERAINAS